MARHQAEVILPGVAPRGWTRCRFKSHDQTGRLGKTASQRHLQRQLSCLVGNSTASRIDAQEERDESVVAAGKSGEQRRFARPGSLTSNVNAVRPTMRVQARGDANSPIDRVLKQ